MSTKRKTLGPCVHGHVGEDGYCERYAYRCVECSQVSTKSWRERNPERAAEIQARATRRWKDKTMPKPLKDRPARAPFTVYPDLAQRDREIISRRETQPSPSQIARDMNLSRNVVLGVLYRNGLCVPIG